MCSACESRCVPHANHLPSIGTVTVESPQKKSGSWSPFSEPETSRDSARIVVEHRTGWLLPSGTPPVLRAYQQRAVEALEAALAAGQRPLLVLPTGAGKTVVLARLIWLLVAADRRVLFLAPRRELVRQTCRKLDDVGVEHGVILADADERAGLGARVQVASVDTVVARLKRHKTLHLPRFDLAIVDEAHLSITKIRTELIREVASQVLGATATPTRLDGKALGILYDTIIEPATTAELTPEHLVPARYFSWPTPDLRNIGTTAGDYNRRDLDRVMNRPQLLGDIREHWLEHARTRRTVVFCTSVAAAAWLAERYRKIGVAAEDVDANTPTREREAVFRRFASGETQVLTNCFLAAYGFDLPVLDCVVLARPTKSLMLYLQMLGRGLRSAPQKRDCLVLDHAGCVHEHGFAIDSRTWTLEGEYALEPPSVREKAEHAAKTCPRCHAIWKGSRTCPECEFELRAPLEPVRSLDGTLVELSATKQQIVDVQDQMRFYAELRCLRSRRGYKPGWAPYKFKEKFGVWPPRAWNDHPIAEPRLSTLRWLKSREIAWAHRRRGTA